MTQIQNDPIYSLPFLYAYGMNVTVASNTTLSIALGQCRDSNDVMDIVIGSAPINGPTTTAPVTLNAAVNGANGLDTGSFAASKVYAVYAIGDSRYYQSPAVLLSLASNTSPTMPQGYDSYRLVGYAVSDASVHFLSAYVSGNEEQRIFTFDAPQATAITAGAATTYTAVDLSALVPPINNIPVSVFTALTPGAAGRGIFLQGAASTGDQVINLGQVTSVVLNSTNTVLAQLASSLPKINYKVSNSGDAVNIKVSGFTFFI